MNDVVTRTEPAAAIDSGLVGLVGVAAYFRIAADPAALARELAMGERQAEAEDVVRAAQLL